MNKLLPILLVSCMFAGELEVEGDLNVSGELQSPTITALLAQIASLEAQIALMQNADNKLETRIYTISVVDPIFDTTDNSHYIDLQILTGYNLNSAKLEFYNITNISSTNVSSVNLEYSFTDDNGQLAWVGPVSYCSQYGCNLSWNDKGCYYSGDNIIRIRSHTLFSADVIISVTAQFPPESNIQGQNTNTKKQNSIKE